MKRTFGLATAMMAVLGFGSIAMANTPKMNTGKNSPPQAEAAKKEDTAMAARTRTARHTRGHMHHRTAARHTTANMKSSTKSAATRKS